MKIKKVKTNFGETLKVGQRIYCIDTHGRADLRVLDFIELTIKELDDRRQTPRNTYSVGGDIGITTTENYSVLAQAVIGDELDADRERIKKPYSSSTAGYFYEYKRKMFYVDKEDAIKGFKKTFKSFFINKKWIPKIFEGTGHKYGNGSEFVGYRYYQYNLRGLK